MHWGALIAGVAFGVAVYALYPELEWEIRRWRRVRRYQRRGGLIP